MRTACAVIGACVLGFACSPGATRDMPDTSVAPQQHALHLTVSGPGSVQWAGAACSSECTVMLAPGTSLHLQAMPSPSAAFTGWSGACAGTGVCDLRMDADAEVGAAFRAVDPPPSQVMLHVRLSGAGGRVVSDPAGIDCGTACDAAFHAGAGVSLRAIPEGTASFSGWSGACSGTGSCSVVMGAEATVTAAFAASPPPPPPGTFMLTVSFEGAGTGRLTSEPEGIDCPSSCAVAMAAGTEVVMTPTPAFGSRFILWSGDACNGIGTCLFKMDQDHHVEGSFVPVPAGHPRYDVTQLAPVVGEQSRPAAMNDAGQVVGNSPSGPWIFDTRSNTVRRLFGPGETRQFIAGGIGRNGDVAGYEVRGNERHAVLVTAQGSVIDLGVSGTLNSANAVNALQQVAGDWLTPQGEHHSFFFDHGAFTDLGTLGGIETLSFAMNERGQVTGQSQLAEGPRHAFLWDGALHHLGSLGGNFSRGQAVNGLGQVAGLSSLTPGDDDLIHAFVWDGSAMRDLGVLPGLPWVSATGINDQGVVVGNVYNKLYPDPNPDPSEPANAHYDSRAYVFRDGVMWDLNELIPDLHVRLRTSLSINSAGQILASEGQVDQEQAHAFVLTPR